MNSFINHICNKAHTFRLQRSLRLAFVVFFLVSFHELEAQPCPVAFPIADFTICSGTIISVALTSDLDPATTFSWTVSQTDVLGASNCPSSCGTNIADTLATEFSSPGSVVYTVTPFANNCAGSPITFTVTVNPIPLAIASNSIICSGATSNVLITSDVTGTAFAWTVNQIAVAGGSSGIGSPISQTLNTTNPTNGFADYTITPTANGCVGLPITRRVNVRQLPVITLGANPAVCQGTTTANLTYSATGGSPNQYSVDYDAAAQAQGFVDVVNATLPASPIILVVPGAAVAGVYNAVLTVRNNTTGCPGASYPITITVNASPTIADAGLDETLDCGITSTTLAANAPAIGTGSWSIFSGAGGSFVDSTDPGTVFNGTAGTTYVLIWTISNAPCPASTDSVTIIFNQTPTTAAAGPDQTACADSATLAGNTPIAGTGLWSIVSGAGGSFVNDTVPTTVFNGVTGTTYVLIWTISNPPCPASSDNVTITLDTATTPAAAGPDQTVCDTSATLAANTPITGTGNWSISSGAGGTFVSSTNPATVFNGVAGTTYILVWTISNPPCTPSTDSVTIIFNQPPTTATAGPDQTECATSDTLAANTPIVGTGIWSISSGAGGTFVSSTNPTTVFNGITGNTYVLVWTISNLPCPASTDSVTITFDTATTPAAAGPDQTVCDTSATLAANTPITGTGSWSIVSGAGGTFVSSINPTTVFNGTVGTSYILIWTISNLPCPASTDSVTITLDTATTPAAAGPDQTVCDTSATLAANTPVVGTGLWSIISGAGGTFVSSTNPTTVFNGVTGTTYVLVWTISNAPCPASTDTVTITLNATAAPATAGPDQTVCGTSATLAANTPITGTGNWSVFSGVGGSFVSSTNPTTLFNGTAGTTYVLVWTISNPPCTPSTDTVNITLRRVPTTATAGPDQTVCATSATLAANAPGVGTGLWSIISGAGGAFVSSTNPTTVFNGVTGTTYVLVWTISNAPCPASTDTVTITLNATAAPATAGPDQTVCGTSATLAANTPITGTGNWSVFSGVGGSFVSSTNPTTLFNGTAGTTYVLVWTISNPPCTPSTDNVTIRLRQPPTPATAGPDQTTCVASATLAANLPITGTGNWSVFSGAGGNFVLTTNPSTVFNGTAGTTYVLIWTISNAPCTASTDSVTIALDTAVTVITVPQSICSPAITVDLTLPAVTAGSTPGLTFTYFTDPGATSPYTTPAAATAGTYYIVGALGDECADTTGITVTVNPKPAVITTNQSVCSPATVNLTLSAVTLGSTGLLTFTYFTDAGATITYTTPTVATAGTYYIVGVTASGCSDTTAVIVTVNTTPTVVTVPQSACAPATINLTLPAVTAGSTGGLTFTYWLDAGATISHTTPTLATTGTYYIVGTTGFCNDTTPVTVTINPKPTVVTNNPATVCAPATVDITLLAVTAGSTGGLIFTYFTDSLATVSYPTPTTATTGTYYIVGTTAPGCSDTTAVTVTITPKPVVNTTPQTACAPATVNLTLGGVTAGSTGGLTFTYFTNAGATTAYPTPTTATTGTYYIVGTAVGGCSDTTAVTVTINPSPTVIITNPAAICEPSTVNLTLPAVTAGSTSGLTFTYWTNAGATNPLGSPGAVAVSGTYYIRGTIGGCSDIEPVIVTINPRPTVVTAPLALCLDATVDLTAPAVTAGSTPGLTFTYFINAGATIHTVDSTAVPAGTYYIVGTTAAGCSDTTPVTVNTLPSVVTEPLQQCYPDTTVDLASAITLGTTPGLTYTYFTDAGATVPYPSPTAATAGTYYIVGTTTDGCTDTTAVTFTVNPKPTVVTNNPAALCSPATVNLTLPAITAGSTVGLSFTYFTNAAATIVYGTPTTAGSGTYYIVGANGFGCTDTTSVTVIIDPAPSVLTTNQAACSPISTTDLTLPAVTAGSTPGLIFTYWLNPAATNPVVDATIVPGTATYYIRGTIPGGCSATTAVTFTVNAKPTVETTPQSICSPGTINLTLPPVTAGSTGGLTFTYFTDAGATVSYPTPTTAGTGTYYIVGTTGAGCSDTTAVVVTINPKPIVVTVPQIACSPPTSTVNLTLSGVTAGSTGGLTFTYFTDPGATSPYGTPTAATNGTYYIVGVTASGCSDTTAVTFTANLKPTLNTLPQSICTPATTFDLTLPVVTAGSTPGLTLTYFTDAGATISYPTPTVATAGTYYIVGVAASGCADTTGITVTVNPKPTVVTNDPATQCLPATINLTIAAVTAGSTGSLTFTYFTDAGATISYPTPATATNGTYYIVGTTIAGCSDTTAVTVTIDPIPTVVTTNPSAVCSSTTVDLTLPAVTAGSTGGLTFTYFTDAGATISYPTPTLATAGTYYIVGSTPGGCSDTTSVTVSISPQPTVVTTNPAAVCSPAIVNLTLAAVTFGSTPGLTYTYFTDPGATIHTVDSTAVAVSGTYYIVGATGAGCSDTTAVTVTINPKPTVITVSQALCLSAFVDLTLTGVTTGSSGGLTFTYFTDSLATASYPTPTAATAGTYYIVGVTAAGCSDTTAVDVTTNATVVTVPQAACSPATIDLTLTGVTTGSSGGLTFTYFTDAGATASYLTPTVATAGTYYIVGVTGSGCSDTTAVTVAIDTTPTVVTVPQAACSPATVDLTLAGVTLGSTAGLTFTYFTDAGATLPYTTPTTAPAGTYFIVGVTLAGCSDTTAVIVTVNSKPTVVTNNPIAVCSPATVDISIAAVTAGSTLGLTYTYFTDSLATTPVADSSAVSVNGIYYIVGITIEGCSDTTAVTVTIDTTPIVVTVPQAACSPATVDLTLAGVTIGSTAGLTFTYFTDSLATVPYPTPTTATTGTYYIVGVTIAGCADTTAVTVTIDSIPAVVTTDPAAVCAPLTIDLTLPAVTAGSTVGLTYTYFTDSLATIPIADSSAVSVSGTYYIVGTTGAGCSDTTAVTVIINPKPTVVTIPQAVCAPDTTVDLTLAGVTLGSTAGLTFSYFTDSLATVSYPTPAVATAGTYYIVGVIAGGCSDTTAVTVTVNPKPIVVTVPQAACSPATVNLTDSVVTAGSTVGLIFIYFTDSLATIPYLTPETATAGTYYILGVTAEGCSDTTAVIVTINPTPTVVTTNPTAVCSPATVDLTIAAVTAGSTPGLTYTYFTDSLATIPVADSSAVSVNGIYYIVGITIEGCSDTTAVTVTIDPKPTVVTVPQAACSPETVDLTLAGVTTGSTTGLTFTYFTDSLATIPYLNDTTATTGIYYIVGVTTAGCSDTTAVTVTINPKPTVITTDPAAVCFPATTDLTLPAVTIGSTLGLTYTYFTDSLAISPVANPTAVTVSGIYYIVGTTVAGCSDTTAVTVTINPKPTVITVPQAVCAPDTTVDLTLAGVTLGSTAGLTLSYFTDSLATITYLTPAVATAGTYYIVGVTGLGCSDTTAVTFTVNPKPTVVTVNPAAVCSPSTVDLTLAGVTFGSTGSLTFTYFTDAGATAQYLTPTTATAGTYYIVGITAAGCSDTTAVIVTINSSPVVTASGINLTCFNICNGNAIATVVGGTSLYTYVWSSGPSSTTAITADTITGLCIGGYTVTVTDANGCFDTGSVIISQPTQINPNITSGNISCIGVCDGASESSPTGGTAPYTFAWNTGSVDSLIINLCPGTYTVIVTDSLGCTSTLSDTIVQAATVLSNAVITNAACGLCNGQIVLNPSGGISPYTYLWGSGQTGNTESNLCAGLYSVNVTDNAGCSSTFSIPISNPGGPTSASITSTNVSCFGLCDGSVTAVTPVGGTAPYSFLWIQSGQTTSTLSNLCAGVYYVQIADSLGCSLIDSVTITEPTQVIVNPFVTAATCNALPCDGNITTAVSGGGGVYTYSWLPGGQITSSITNQCAGLYSVQITDVASGCIQNIVIPLTSPGAPTLTTSITPLTCNGACDATASVVATGGTSPYTYLWNDPAPAQITSTATALCAGTYFVQVTGGGCSSFAAVSITAPDPIGFAFANTIDPLCNGSSNGSIAVIPFGGTLPYTFTWTGSGSVSNTANNLSAGIYTVTVTDANGCSSTQTNTLIDPTSLTISNAVTPASCNTTANGAIDVTVGGGSPGYTYQWSGGSALTTQDLDSILVGTYTITVTDTNGCTITDTIIVTSTVTVLADAGNDTAFCEPGSMLLTAAGSSSNITTYQWFQISLPTDILIGSTMNVLVNPPLGATDYYVIVDTGAICSNSDTITVTVNPLPVANAGADVTIIANTSTVIGGTPTGPAGSTYSWNPTLGLDNATNANPVSNPTSITTTYTVTVTTPEGCTSSDVVIVTVVANITFPNGISPNGDGTNDEWIIDNIELFPKSVVEVYNRWGELLFQSVGYLQKWRGEFKGQPLPVGTYYYIINLNDPFFLDAFTGPITILR